jgi:hypothetical protein
VENVDRNRDRGVRPITDKRPKRITNWSMAEMLMLLLTGSGSE